MEQIKPNKRYLLAQDEDLSLNLSLKTNFNELNEFNNSKIISLTELFTKERNESYKYRIYGNINYFSFLRNKAITNDITTGSLETLFVQNIKNTFFNFENFFDVKIFKLKSAQDTYNDTGSTFVERLEVVSGDSILNYFAYSRNIFGERNYHFRFNTLNLNPSNLILLSSSTKTQFIYDNDVYVGIIPKVDFNSNTYEKLYYTTDFINQPNSASTFGYSAKTFTDAQIDLIINGSNFTRDDFKKYFLSKLQIFFRIYNLEISTTNINNNLRFIRNYIDIGNGDYNKKTPNTNIKAFDASTFDLSNVEGNYKYFDKENYTFNNILKKEYLIAFEITDSVIPTTTYTYDQWKADKGYSAFTLTESQTQVSVNNITITTKIVKIKFWFKYYPFQKIELKRYSDFLNEFYTGITQNVVIPENAVFYENRYIWRDLLTYGDSANYDYPFVNNNHYVYNDILFYLKPDLSDRNTTILVNEFLTEYPIRNYTFNKENIKPIGPPRRKSIC